MKRTISVGPGWVVVVLRGFALGGIGAWVRYGLAVAAIVFGANLIGFCWAFTAGLLVFRRFSNRHEGEAE